mmetsp:Transcript_41166/g.85946  ORF Transcript_41166/g.85946 Transcript_41166/m.85946 type:complete len:228 (-) Transcript_41166:290-973(-)
MSLRVPEHVRPGAIPDGDRGLRFHVVPGERFAAHVAPRRLRARSLLGPRRLRPRAPRAREAKPCPGGAEAGFEAACGEASGPPVLGAGAASAGAPEPPVCPAALRLLLGPQLHLPHLGVCAPSGPPAPPRRSGAPRRRRERCHEAACYGRGVPSQPECDSSRHQAGEPSHRTRRHREAVGLRLGGAKSARREALDRLWNAGLSGTRDGPRLWPRSCRGPLGGRGCGI